MKEKSTYNYPSSPFPPPPPLTKIGGKYEDASFIFQFNKQLKINFWLPDQTLKTLNKEYAWKWDFNHIFPIRVELIDKIAFKMLI